MRFMTVAAARGSDFRCEGWSALPVNATREEIGRGGFVHDVYKAPFTGSFDRAVEALLTYQIFAPHRMHARVCTADQVLALGATIVQRVLIEPVALETAVRVIELVQTGDRAIFAYATLEGHPERGVASFAVIRDAGECHIEAQAWSRAGTWLTMLGRPVSRAMQRAFTREAVDYFVQRANVA